MGSPPTEKQQNKNMSQGSTVPIIEKRGEINQPPTHKLSDFETFSAESINLFKEDQQVNLILSLIF